MTNFVQLLETLRGADKPILITFADKISLTCRILSIHSDYLKVNQMAFNKLEKQYSATSNNYFIPFTAIMFIEEPKG